MARSRVIFQEIMGLCGEWQDKIFPTKSFLPYFSDLVRSFRILQDHSGMNLVKSTSILWVNWQ